MHAATMLLQLATMTRYESDDGRTIWQWDETQWPEIPKQLARVGVARFAGSLHRKAPASRIERSRAPGGRGRRRPGVERARKRALDDRPLVVAGLHNGQDDQPFAAGVDSGANHPGVIAGYRTPTLDWAGYNHWPTHDAQGQLRSRMLSITAASQANIGYRIQQRADGWPAYE